MKKSLLIINVLLIILIHYSCSCLSCGNGEEASVPLNVLENADAFIISKTGEQFFNNYIATDFFRTKHDAPFFNMVYRFSIPEKPYVDAFITFTVDSAGNIMMDKEITGIPNCILYPQQCEFNIDEQNAIRIAVDNGLEHGVKEWKTGLIWDAKYDKYVWHILSTFEETESELGYKANGKEVIIDPSSGEVIALNDWNIK